MKMTREVFEAWVSAPPYERSIERQGDAGSWPGQYRSYDVQLAWESWHESAKSARKAFAALCDAFGDDAAIGWDESGDAHSHGASVMASRLADAIERLGWSDEV